MAIGVFFYISYDRVLLSRKLLSTTLTLENAMAPAAIIGFKSPSAARGIAATL